MNYNTTAQRKTSRTSSDITFKNIISDNKLGNVNIYCVKPIRTVMLWEAKCFFFVSSSFFHSGRLVTKFLWENFQIEEENSFFLL